MTPLAERMRPQTLTEFVGQEHLVGENAVLRQAIERGKIPSFILWGPPGVGKTTLAAMFPSPVFIQAEDGTSVFDSWDEDAPEYNGHLPRCRLLGDHQRSLGVSLWSHLGSI